MFEPMSQTPYLFFFPDRLTPEFEVDSEMFRANLKGS